MSKTIIRLHVLVFAALVGLSGWSESDAAVIDGYEQARNDRFVADGSFIGDGFDWSGVGLSERARWGTLVGPNTVISAGHFAPSGNISFYAEDDPESELVQRTIVRGERIAETDLWVGCLGEAVPDSITTYTIATDLLTSGNFSSWAQAGSEVFLVGRSPSAHIETQDVAVGRNTIVAFGEDDVFQSGLGVDLDSIGLVYDRPEFIPGEPNPNYVEFEAHLEVGDSGAPLFAVVDGQLVLLGVNSFITETNSIASHASYVGNQSDAIHSISSECAAAVPEPEMAIPLLCLGVLVTLRRRSL